MALILDLLRHGAAAPSHDLGDFHRPLTAEGERAIRGLSRRLGALPERPSRTFSSPLRRAWDTAELVARSWNEACPIEALPELAPNIDPVAVVEALAHLGLHDGHVLLVGHQPQMGLLSARLTGSENRFAPGTLLRVECPVGPRGPGRLVFVLPVED